MARPEIAAATGTEVWLSTELTGVYHGAPDCPATRDRVEGGWYVYRAQLSHGTAVLVERDIDLGAWAPAASPSVYQTAVYQRELQLDLNRWRPCLRCGAGGSAGPVTICPTCHLTTCDCDG